MPIPPIDTLPPTVPLVTPVPVTLQALVVITTRAIWAFGLYPAGSPDPRVEVVNLDESLRATLESPGSKVLNADGTITVTAPPALPPILSTRQDFDKSITTTTAAATELFGYDLPSMTIYDVTVVVVAIDRGNGDTKRFSRTAVIRRLGGAPSVIGAVLTPTADQASAGAAAWTMTPAFAGNRLTFTVVGALGRTIDWSIFGDARRFTPGGI